MPKTMRKVVMQEDATGCGIACAAMLAGKTYHAVKKQAKELGLFADDLTLYSDIYHLRPLLASYNIRIGRNEPFRNWKDVPSPAILAINYRPDPDSPSWHWAVFRQDESGPVVLDPRKTRLDRERTDLGNVKPQWFIPVRPGSTGC